MRLMPLPYLSMMPMSKNACAINLLRGRDGCVGFMRKSIGMSNGSCPGLEMHNEPSNIFTCMSYGAP